MAKQDSIITLVGTLGNLSFYKRDGEYRVRLKSGVSKERILKDPKFARTRENMTQFALIANDLKLFNKAISTLRNHVGGKVRTAELNSLLHKVASLDTVSVRGNKQVAIGFREERGIQMFRDLQLAKQSVSFFLAEELEVDRTTGIITSEEFVPSSQLFHLPSATHFEFKSGVVAVDFEGKTHAAAYSDASLHPIDDTPVTLSLDPGGLPSAGVNPVYFVLISLVYYMEDNGVLYPLKSTNSICLDIIDAFTV